MSRKEELMNYLELLLRMYKNDMDVKSKIEQVLNALHNEMGFLHGGITGNWVSGGTISSGTITAKAINAQTTI